jgi:3-hydroxymyristoyl/3-hydroxydecanoyl-(acyl carrier protein) dehydratase
MLRIQQYGKNKINGNGKRQTGNREKIEMRFVFVDRIEEIEKNRYAKGIKAISFEEGFLKSPRRQDGIFPPLLLMECAAQLAAWLIMYSSDFKWIPMMAKMGKVSLFEIVKTGDTICIEVNILSLHEEEALLNAEIFTVPEGRLIARGENCLCVFADLDELADKSEMQARFRDLCGESP